MKYTVEDKNGTPHGPITEEEVLELVQQDLLLSDSKMKKAMMPTWDKAGSFDFLKDAFAEQQERLAEEDPSAKNKKTSKKEAGNKSKGPAKNSK